MRQAILDYLQNNSGSLSPLIVTDNLPWTENGGPLYETNKKYIYVDLDEVKQDSTINTFDLAGTIDETTVVRVFFVIDAKQNISNYEDIVQVIKDGRLTTDVKGLVSRTCQVTTSFINDTVLTTFEFSFKKLITN